MPSDSFTGLHGHSIEESHELNPARVFECPRSEVGGRSPPLSLLSAEWGRHDSTRQISGEPTSQCLHRQHITALAPPNHFLEVKGNTSAKFSSHYLSSRTDTIAQSRKRTSAAEQTTCARSVPVTLQYCVALWIVPVHSQPLPPLPVTLQATGISLGIALYYQYGSREPVSYKLFMSQFSAPTASNFNSIPVY